MEKPASQAAQPIFWTVPNIITTFRLLLIFVAIGFLFSSNDSLKIAAIVAIPLAILLDMADGQFARRLNQTSTFGAVYDIAADRLVELSLWFVFAQLAVVPLWMALVVLSRGVIVDALRSVALTKGYTPFGKDTMMLSRLGHALTASRTSRGLYAVVKFLVFPVLGLAAVFPATSSILLHNIEHLALPMAYITVGFSLLRGLPVIFESTGLFRKIMK